MNVDLHSQGFAMTEALTQHVRRRLDVSLARHADCIKRVGVRLGDENGPRGGADKFCRIQVHLLDARVAVIEEVGVDLYAAIGSAAGRVGRVVVKHLDRTHPSRDIVRQGPRPARDRHGLVAFERAPGSKRLNTADATS